MIQTDYSGMIYMDEDEQPKYSLYELVKNLREWSQDNPTLENPPVARLLYAAFMNEGIKEAQKIDIDQQISDVIKQIESESEEDIEHQLTGFLYIKGNFILHFLEGDSNVINVKFIRDYLYSEYKKEKSVYQNINIICFTEENPTRFYDKFYSPNSGAYQPAPPLTTELDKTDEQIQDRTWEIYNMFCEAGKRHSDKKQREKQSKRLENEIQLQVDDMSMLMLKHYMSIEDYYEMYLEDIEINLDSEKVYPYTPNLISNLEYSESGDLPKILPVYSENQL